MTRPTAILVLLGVLLTALAAPAAAHRVSIYAYASGGTIYTESRFSKSKPVVNGEVRVFNAANDQPLLAGDTDAEGLFQFPIPAAAREERMDLKLTIRAGEGHTGDWLLSADEYLNGGDGAPVAGGVASPPTENLEAPATDMDTPAPGRSQTPDAELQAAVKQALAESLGPALDAALEPRLAPMRRSLAAMENPEPGLRDIIGGLGWIVGLAGAAVLVRSRNNKR